MIRRVKTITDSHINQNIFRFSLRLLQTILKCHYANSKSREKHKNIHKFNVLYLNNQHFLTLSHPQDLIPSIFTFFKTLPSLQNIQNIQNFRSFVQSQIMFNVQGLGSENSDFERMWCSQFEGVAKFVFIAKEKLLSVCGSVAGGHCTDEECANTCYLLLCTPLILRGERGPARNQDYS